MKILMDEDGQWKSWLADELPPDLLLTPLAEGTAREVVDRLKQEADRYWTINPKRSLEYAERIIAIGRARNDPPQIALGTMARGDALRFLGRMEEAWKTLEIAGNIYQNADDEVGWARTRIGRLPLGLELNCVLTVLNEAEEARRIFERNREDDKLLRLYWEIASVHIHRGEQNLARALYDSALKIADRLGEAGQQYLGSLYIHLGATYNALGDFRQALNYYEQARAAFTQDQALNIARVERSIAEIAQAQGQYRRALTLLQSALERVSNISPFQEAMIKQQLVECYLSLNRNTEARDLAQHIIQNYQALTANYELAYTLLCFATAEAELGDFGSAQKALKEAEAIFDLMKADTWVAMIHIKRGQIALKQGDPKTSLQEAIFAAAYFEEIEQQFNFATANLLKGRALFALGNLAEAVTEGNKALIIAQRYNIPSLRYAAHLLLGQIAEARNENTHSIRRYRAAVATIERVQRDLTITIRPEFLEDKGEAWRSLVTMQLRSRNAKSALESLERAKSQLWLGYLTNRERLQWSQDDEHSQALIEKLNQLRSEHRWFYQMAHGVHRTGEQSSTIQPNQALAEIAERERQMRAITEKLYLHSDGGQGQTPVLSLEAIQQTLSEETVLVEYYNDGEQFWAFTVDRRIIRVCHLPLTTETLNRLLGQLQINLAAALKINPNTPAAKSLTQLTRRILSQLYNLLIEPLELKPDSHHRLTIVPYGALHFLPFQLLHDGLRYLIERCEIVILPAAGLAARPIPKRSPGALVLAHSWENRLLYTHAEGKIVHRLFGGQLYMDEAADRSTFQTKPTQILHIAAHGHYRLDQPDLSYLQLADGQLYTDDIFQHDLSYELVTLSACETGRANVAAYDELIGLGRGFLYAGAGTLILSLWSVADSLTVDLMEMMYSLLSRGFSKVAALREAQRSILSENRDLHPAFWGAFQLIGDAGPLSEWAEQPK